MAVEEPFHFVTIFPSAVVLCVHSLQRIGVYSFAGEQHASNLESLSFALNKNVFCFTFQNTHK